MATVGIPAAARRLRSPWSLARVAADDGARADRPARGPTGATPRWRGRAAGAPEDVGVGGGADTAVDVGVLADGHGPEVAGDGARRGHRRRQRCRHIAAEHGAAQVALADRADPRGVSSAAGSEDLVDGAGVLDEVERAVEDDAGDYRDQVDAPRSAHPRRRAVRGSAAAAGGRRATPGARAGGGAVAQRPDDARAWSSDRRRPRWSTGRRRGCAAAWPPRSSRPTSRLRRRPFGGSQPRSWSIAANGATR